MSRRRDEPEFTSYYGRPILQEPVWEARSIASYLFLGGLAGASSVLAAGAQATGRERLATSTKTAALGAIGLSVVALVEDLGRPERFPMMLRVVKPTSPMSVGSWILSAYGPAAGAAALIADYLPDATPVVVPEGRVRATMRVSHYHGLKRLVAGMPGLVTVLEPAEARRVVADWAAAGAARYET